MHMDLQDGQDKRLKRRGTANGREWTLIRMIRRKFHTEGTEKRWEPGWKVGEDHLPSVVRHESGIREGYQHLKCFFCVSRFD